MEDFSLEIEQRKEFGSSACRRFRRDGKIPVIMYSRGKEENVPGLVSRKEFVRLGERALPSQIFTFKSSVDQLNGKKAIVKDIRTDFIKNKVLHVDFQVLHDDQEVKVNIPIAVVGGDPFGVKNEGGVATVTCRSITVSCLPGIMPTRIEIDASHLKLGERIRTKEIDLPEGVRLRGNPEESVISVLAARAAKVAEETTEEAEGGEAAAADGEAPAGGDAKPEGKE